MKQWLGRILGYSRFVGLSAFVNRPLAPPITASISITSRCNSSCRYCSYNRSRRKVRTDVSMTDIRRILVSLEKLGVAIVTFTGGEPLLRADLEESVRAAKDLGLMVHLTSNGVLLTEKRVESLACAGVDNIVISLDSIEAEIHEAQRGVPFGHSVIALDALKHFTSIAPGGFGLVTSVVTRANYSRLSEFVRRIAQVGGRRILVNLQPYHRPPDPARLPKEMRDSLSQEDWEMYRGLKEEESSLLPEASERRDLESVIGTIIELKRQGYPVNNSEFFLSQMPSFLIDNQVPVGLTCRAGFTGIYIQENLNVVPCWRLPAIGNLASTNLEDTWYSRTYTKTRRRMLCRECPGCMFLCHNETGWYSWYDSVYREKLTRNGASAES